MKNLIPAFFAIAVCLATIGCNDNTTDNANNGETGDTTARENLYAEAVLGSSYEDTVVNGTAKFEQNDNGNVRFTLELTVPAKANQSVAVHLHEHGNCGDAGNHAGGHWNPTGVNHGKWGEDPFHIGDIGNVELDSEGKGKIELETDLWSIGGDEKKNILNKAVVVHGGTDDYTSQPSGNAGTRIGCGTIMKK